MPEPDLILKACQVELDLTVEQIRWCERAGGVSRAAYNWGLGEWRRWYRWSSIDKRARKLGAFWARLPAEPGDTKPRLNNEAGEQLARRAVRKWRCGLSIRAVKMCRIWNGYDELKREQSAAKSSGDKEEQRRIDLKIRLVDKRVRDLVDKVTEKHRFSIGPSAFGIHGRLTPLKKETQRFHWMTSIGCAYVARDAIQVSLKGAYEAFFRRVKKHAAGDHSECGISKYGRCQLGEPRFRRYSTDCSFINDQGSSLQTRCELVKIDSKRGGDNKRRVRHEWRSAVRMPGIGWLEAKRGQRLPVARFDNKSDAWVGDPGVKLCGIGIRRWGGKWYAALRVWVPRPKVKPATTTAKLAVETGVRFLAVTYDGERVDYVKGTREIDGIARLERRRKLWERRMARRWNPKLSKREQSKNWCEARDEVAKYHRLIASMRANMLHRTSRRVIDQHAETLVIRDMGVKTMLARGAQPSDADRRKRNALAPMVSVAGMGEFARQLTYKQEWLNGKIVVESRDVPSTRTCHVCSHVLDDDPGYPYFRCPSCGHVEDRDVNAVKNRFDYRPPSGEPVGGAGPRRRNTAGKPAATAERTGKRGREVSSLVRPDASETSESSSTARLGAGNGTPTEAPASGGEKGRRAKARRAQPGTAGIPAGHLIYRTPEATDQNHATNGESPSDQTIESNGSSKDPEGGRSARASRSQSGVETRERSAS